MSTRATATVGKQKVDPVEILDTVEKNEKISENISDEHINQASQLLSFDNQYFNFKKQVIAFKEYPEIRRMLENQESERYGISQCISMNQSFLYVGNSEGFIRIFDLKEQTEQPPL
jgi:hypothetical protein